MLDEIKNSFRNGGPVIQLILVNGAIFIVSGLIGLVSFLFQADFTNPFTYFALPADFMRALGRPWSIITYMFVHGGFFHIFFNMLMLFFAGRIFVDFLGRRRVFSTYLLGGLAGGLVFMISYNLFPVFEQQITAQVLVGASAAVLAILMATASFVPNYGVYIFVFGPIPLKYVAAALVVIDLLSISRGNPGGHLAHLGGAIYGFTFARLLKQGRNVTGRLDDLFEGKGLPKRKPKMKIVHKQTRSDAEYLQKKRNEQARMDEILDKISKSGYDSLTAEEKEILFRMSKDL